MNKYIKIKFGMIGSLLSIMLSLGVLADSISPPKAFAKSSPSGSHYFIMTPPQRDEIGEIVSLGGGKCFMVGKDGSSTVVWTTKGWHNSMIFLSDDGIHLASVNYWPPETKLSPDTAAIWFFRKGVEFRRINVIDLIEDESALLVSASHLQWLYNQVDACSLFNERLDVKTIEGRRFSFDIRSGDFITE